MHIVSWYIRIQMLISYVLIPLSYPTSHWNDELTSSPFQCFYMFVCVYVKYDLQKYIISKSYIIAGEYVVQ